MDDSPINTDSADRGIPPAETLHIGVHAPSLGLSCRLQAAPRILIYRLQSSSILAKVEINCPQNCILFFLRGDESDVIVVQLYFLF